MAVPDAQPSAITRESAYRLPHPVGPVRRALPPKNVPKAVRVIERAMRASAGPSAICFRFRLTVRFASEGLVSAEIIPYGEVDERALDRIRESVEALVVTGRSRIVKAFEIYYLVAVSSTYVEERMRRQVEEITSRLFAACPSFREPWEWYVSGAGYDPESISMAETAFADHAAGLVAAGRVGELAAPLAAIESLASTGESWAVEARRVLLMRLLDAGVRRNVDVGAAAAVMPPGMRSVWEQLWASRDEDVSHDPYY